MGQMSVAAVVAGGLRGRVSDISISGHRSQNLIFRYLDIKGRTIQPKLDWTDPVKSAASESADQYRSDTD